MKNIRRVTRKYYFKEVVACFLISCLFFNTTVLLATPSGGSVSGDAGSATITYNTGTNLLTTQVDLDTMETIIDWDKLDTLGGDVAVRETLKFLGTENAAVLNRVWSEIMTNFNGDLSAAGLRVFIIAPNGMTFGPGSYVQARQLVASGLQMENADFLEFLDGTITKMKFEGGLGESENNGSTMTAAGTIEATGSVYLVGTQVVNSGTISSPLVVMAAGSKVYLSHLGSDVYIEAPSDLLAPDTAGNMVDNQGMIFGDDQQSPTADVVLASGDVFSAAMDVGSLAAVAHKDITLTGAVETDGDMTLTADFDENGTGSVYAQSKLTSTEGTIDISASDSTIDLDYDVSADVDLLLNNNTVAAGGITLSAGQDVVIGPLKSIRAEGSLAIEAGQEIKAESSDIIMTLNDSILKLTQNPTLDIEADFRSINNRANTDLDATSVAGTVTSDEAAEWKTITASAQDSITLSDTGGDITTLALTATTGNVTITADNYGQVLAKEDIIAGSAVTLTADDGIVVSKNITAGAGITFNDKVTADGGDQVFDTDGAGTDLIANDDIIKSTAGNLTLGAGTQPDAQIELAGDVTTTDGHLIFWDKVIANGDGDQKIDADGVGKDLIADDDIIKSTSGNLTLGAGTQLNAEIYLPGDVTTTDGHLIFWDKVIANGDGDQVFDADGAGKDLIADDDIIKSTAGNLTLGAGTQPDAQIELPGDVMTTNGHLIFWDQVIANGDGDQRLDAQNGILDADGDITKTSSGSLTLAGDAGIFLGGDVSTNTQDGIFSMNHLIFENAVTADGTGDNLNQTFTAAPVDATAGSTLHAYSSITKKDGGDLAINDDGGNLTLKGGWQTNLDGDVTVEDGTLTIEADQDVYLGGNVRSAGDMVIKADADGDADLLAELYPDYTDIIGGDVTADGTLTSERGSIDISGFDDTIYLNDNVTALIDILLHNNTVVSGGVTLDAGQDVIVGDKLEAYPEMDKYPDEDVYTDTDVTGSGDLVVGAGRNITIGGDVDIDGAVTMTAGVDISAKSVSSYYDMSLDAGQDVTIGRLFVEELWADDDTDSDLDSDLDADLDSDLDADLDSDSDKVLVFKGGQLDSEEDMSVTAGRDITFKNALADGYDFGMYMDAGRDIQAGVEAPAIEVSGYRLDEVVTVTQGGSISAGDDIELNAGRDIKAKWLWTESDYASIDLTAGENILIGGIFPTLKPTIYDSEGRNIGSELIGINEEAVVEVYKGGGIWASEDITLHAVEGDIKLKHAETSDGDIDMTAGQDILVGGSAPHAVLVEGEPREFPEIEVVEFDKGGRLWAADGYGDSITLNAGRDISLKMAEARDDITITADQDITFRTNQINPGSSPADDRTESEKGDIRIRSYNGDISFAAGYELMGGEPRYRGSRSKGGGVSIIAENGKIFSPGGDNDTLNISVTGYSSQLHGIGVELPYDPDHLAGIVIMSGEDLILGENSMLMAGGKYLPLDQIDFTGITNNSDLESYGEELLEQYGIVIEVLQRNFENYLYDQGGDELNLEDPEDFSLYMEILGDYLGSLDDRPAVALLDSPATIGGFLRDEGDPIDVGIYLASAGNVDVSSEVTLYSSDYFRNADIDDDEDSDFDIEQVHRGAMVIDALDTITFGPAFESSLAGDGTTSDVGDRLEVVSRLSEWLASAEFRLPHSGGGGPFVPGYSYVLRGSGLDNSLIGDGRAWVLEDNTDPAALYEEAGETAEEQEFGEGGCPALMQWLSAEIGVPADEIQVFMANASSLSTDIQPCEACGRLRSAALALEDPDGARLASLAQVVGEFVTPGAPISPEQMTLVASAVASPAQGSVYASAGDWLDGLVAYVGIMSTELGLTPAEAVAFAGKYTAAATGSSNASLAAYVQARIAVLSGI